MTARNGTAQPKSMRGTHSHYVPILMHCGLPKWRMMACALGRTCTQAYRYPPPHTVCGCVCACRLWTGPLLQTLASVRQRGSVYVGMMQWQGGCEHSDVRNGAGEEAQSCSGCWGGWFNFGASAPRNCMPMWRAGWSGSVKEGSAECPMFRLAPFACGPFEARSRQLALAVSRCQYADNYFAAMSRRGNAKRDWCVSADGGQGHAVGACVRSLHIADFGPHRQKYASEKELNSSHSVFIVHPLKSRGSESDSRRLSLMLGTWKRMWSYLRRASPVLVAPAEARVQFRLNESRPFVERAVLAFD